MHACQWVCQTLPAPATAWVCNWHQLGGNNLYGRELARVNLVNEPLNQFNVLYKILQHLFRSTSPAKSFC